MRKTIGNKLIGSMRAVTIEHKKQRLATTNDPPLRFKHLLQPHQGKLIISPAFGTIAELIILIFLRQVAIPC